MFPLLPQCGNCKICRDICERKVLKGTTWNSTNLRDNILDVYGCSTCLKCLVHCPRTQKYVKAYFKNSGNGIGYKNKKEYTET